MLHLFYSIQQNPFFMQTTEMNCLLSHQSRLTACDITMNSLF